MCFFSLFFFYSWLDDFALPCPPRNITVLVVLEVRNVTWGRVLIKSRNNRARNASFVSDAGR